jgi:hypothetical protein
MWPSLTSKWMEATYLTDRSHMLSSMETYTATFTGDGEDYVYTLGPPTSTPLPIEYPRGQGYWSDAPQVFVNGKVRSDDPTDPTGYLWSSPSVIFTNPPADGSTIWIIYKQPVHKTTMSDSPRTPYIIGEWDFELSHANETLSTNHFRGITCYGITDYHDGVNPDMHLQKDNKIDREVQYQLDEVFNPFDLYSAVEKKSTRWVEFHWGDEFPVTLDYAPVMNVSDDMWDQYGVFSERVIDLNTSTLLGRWEYSFSVNAWTGYGTIGGPIFLDDHYYKILYSTDTSYESNMHEILTNDWINVTRAYANGISYSDGDIFTDYLGAQHEFDMNSYFYVTNATNNLPADLANYTLSGTFDWEAQEIEVNKEVITSINLYDIDGAAITGTGSGIQITLDEFELNWAITSPFQDRWLDMIIDHAHMIVEWSIYAIYNATVGTFNVTATFNVGGSERLSTYSERIPGRYEWITAGRDASTVDSLGAADVAAAFKNKFVEIGNTALDMNGATYQYQVPYLLSKSTSGKTPDFQNYWLTPDATSPGQRLALADDWCTRYPVSSSNIIAVGGPLANQITGYFNEFTDALYAAPWFTPYVPYKGAIVPLSCWSKMSPAHIYTNTGGANGTGYATIGTYLDLNGTVGFVIYGLDARDTFYATKFFHEDIIYELQGYPYGATSIVIKIDYTDMKHPTFSIPEVLGTISETTVIDWMVKGGIHPDP